MGQLGNVASRWRSRPGDTHAVRRRRREKDGAVEARSRAAKGRAVSHRKEPATNQGGNLTWSVGQARRCSFVTDPGGTAPHSRLVPGENPRANLLPLLGAPPIGSVTTRGGEQQNEHDQSVPPGEPGNPITAVDGDVRHRLRRLRPWRFAGVGQGRGAAHHAGRTHGWPGQRSNPCSHPGRRGPRTPPALTFSHASKSPGSGRWPGARRR